MEFIGKKRRKQSSLTHTAISLLEKKKRKKPKRKTGYMGIRPPQNTHHFHGYTRIYMCFSSAILLNFSYCTISASACFAPTFTHLLHAESTSHKIPMNCLLDGLYSPLGFYIAHIIILIFFLASVFSRRCSCYPHVLRNWREKPFCLGS